VVILQKRIAGLSEAALNRFVRRARRAAGLRGLANVLVTNSVEMRTLNRQFRGKNQPTDVLSFPSLLPISPGRRNNAAVAGEIAISADIAAQNAVQLGHTTAEEVKILALHGILHLAGFDHERDNGEMARQEMRLRQRLNLPVALIERADPAKHASSNRRGKLPARARRMP